MGLIAGVDEAGRGPLAGPVVAAVVVLPEGRTIEGVRDSKKVSEKQREALFTKIQSQAEAWAIGSADVAEIDSLNILGATMLAMQRAVGQLQVLPRVLRVDGNRKPKFVAAIDAVTETLVGGDDICPAIGAASILAKVHRDRIMRALDLEYPGYGFDRHKGYPTAAHRQALLDLGVTPVHRLSFRPVKDAARLAGEQVLAGD